MPDKKTTATDEMAERVQARMRERGMGFLSRYSILDLLTAALDAAPTTDEGPIDYKVLFEREESRAEKAEQERDEARESLSRAKGAVESLRTMTARDHLNAACQAGHPLPKGATIPEGAAFWVRSPGEPWEFVSPGPAEDFDTSPFPNSQYVLLDPPRPKGAEAWDEELGEMPAASDLTAEQRARLADALAERDHALGVRFSEGGAS